jgi:LysR family transcriptional regulator, regulator for metE and metH
MLELRHLRSLLAITRSPTLSSAAARLHLTQSALSHQIRAMETYYGLALFERQPRGLRLTLAGKRLVTLARSVLPQVEDAQRDLTRLQSDTRGEMRIALECHTCFDWLMPVMDEFRRRWPEVEVDLVAGFHSDPLGMLRERRADVVIGSAPRKRRTYVVRPLFRFEILLVIPNEHRLRGKRFVEARDLLDETLITYPVPEARIDLIREILAPAGMRLERRTAELTVAVLQLVASRRGIAALPNWGVKNYVEHEYVLAKHIGRRGLWSELHATAPKVLADKLYFNDFVSIVRTSCEANLEGIELLDG